MRMEECANELQNLLEEDKLAGIPLLIYANKQDLMEAQDADELEEELQLNRIDDRTWSIFPCSATDNEGKKTVKD